MKLKGLIGIQARSLSKRLPNKIFEEIHGKSMLEHVVDRCRKTQVMEGILDIDVVVLCPENDDKVMSFCESKHIACVGGSEEDLVKRYVTQCQNYDLIVRVTADCWQINPILIGKCFKALTDNDYASNTVFRSYPEGWDVQAARSRAWEWLDRNQKDEREHPWKIFDENNLVREQFGKDGLSWQPIIDRGNVIFLKTSIDTADELKRARESEG